MPRLRSISGWTPKDHRAAGDHRSESKGVHELQLLEVYSNSKFNDMEKILKKVHIFQFFGGKDWKPFTVIGLSRSEAEKIWKALGECRVMRYDCDPETIENLMTWKKSS